MRKIYNKLLSVGRAVVTRGNSLFARVKSVKYIEWVLLLVILTGAFGVRLYKIGNPLADWHSWRQSDTASVSRIYIDEGIDVLTPRYYDISAIQTGLFNPNGYRFVEFPIFNIFHALLASNFPLSFYANSFEVWGRLLAIICALVTTICLFLLGKQLFGKWGGLLTAGFYAFLPFNIYFTRVILPEPMTAMFAVISLYTFLRFTQTDRNHWLWISAIAFAFAMLLKPYIAFFGVPIGYLALCKFGHKNIFKNKQLIIAFLLVIVPFALWRSWLQQHPEGIPFYKWAFNGDEIRFRPAFWNWIFGERVGRLILGVWGLVPFVFGLIVPLDTNDKRFSGSKQMASLRWFIHMCLLGAFVYLSLVATANVRHDYYQAIIVPFICLALAHGSLVLWNSPYFHKWLSRSLLVFSIGVMLIVSALQVREYYKINHPEIIEAGKAIDGLIAKDALVIAPYNGDAAFLYQTKRRGWPFVELPIPELIEKGASYWVSVNYGDPQTLEVMEKYTIMERTPQYVIVDLTKPKTSL
jgi:hypothetical protein